MECEVRIREIRARVEAALGKKYKSLPKKASRRSLFINGVCSRSCILSLPQQEQTATTASCAGRHHERAGH